MQSLLRRIHFSLHHPLRRARPSSWHSRVPPARRLSEFPSSNKQFRARGTSRLTPTTLVIGFIPLLTFALGTWQVKRRRWKLDLIEHIEGQAHRAPLELPDFVNLNVLAEFAYRKFTLKGKWDHDHSILVGPRTRDGIHGYHVVTPLVREGGSIVLVDRGFVSKELVLSVRDLRNIDHPQGEVEVQGLLCLVPTRNFFTPDNNPEKGEWYWLDVACIGKWAGGNERGVQNILFEELFEGNSGEVANLVSRGIPVGRSEHIELRNMHTTYAVTWYSLSIATAIMFVGLLRRPHPSISWLRTR